LHDIGKVVLDQYLQPILPLFYRWLQQNEADLISAEEHIFGTNHTQVGKLLAQSWSFPNELEESLCYHHNPEAAVINPELAHMVYLADLLASRFLSGHELEQISTENATQYLKFLGLTPNELLSFVEALPLESSFEV